VKRSKRYLAGKEKIDRNRLYEASEAVKTIRDLATTEGTKVKFDETIDIAFNLNIKAKHTIRDTLILPHPIKQEEKKILVFAKGEKATEAEESGAAYIGDTELIEKIKGGWIDFDVVISTPDMMKDVGKLGPILGRKGLMPNPKTGTVTFNIKETIEEFKKGKVEYRADKTGIVHLSIGKASMDEEKILENAKSIYNEILRKRPSDLKGEYIRSVGINSTMGPGIKIVHSTLN
jgi:large subunit ribosomal protein L1